MTNLTLINLTITLKRMRLKLKSAKILLHSRRCNNSKRWEHQTYNWKWCKVLIIVSRHLLLKAQWISHYQNRISKQCLNNSYRLMTTLQITANRGSNYQSQLARNSLILTIRIHNSNSKLVHKSSISILMKIVTVKISNKLPILNNSSSSSK